MSEVTADQAAEAQADAGAPPATEPPAETKPAPATAYLILSQDKSGNWTEQTTVQARGAEAAIRDWLKGATEVEGTYVAVPARSWKPVSVKTETQTKLAFS